MAVDVSGGLDPASDYPIVAKPEDPAYGENHAFWIFDKAGEYSLLHLHLNAPAGAYGGEAGMGWEARSERLTVTMPGGRRLAYVGYGKGTTVQGPSGGRLSFRCVEPFVRWTGSFEGQPFDTTASALMVGPVNHGPVVDASFSFDATMVVPPWVQGAMLAKAGKPVDEEGLRYIGGDRYEQLCDVKTTLSVDGETISFSGTGMRTHRRGVRNTVTMVGHSWLTAVFPSGRAFGLMRFPRPDGSVGFSEAFVYEGDGELIPADVVDSPWLTSLEDAGESFAVRLETPSGPVAIDGVSIAHTFDSHHGVRKNPTGFTMSHGMARYTWDGEVAYGQIERSGMVDAAKS